MDLLQYFVLDYAKEFGISVELSEEYNNILKFEKTVSTAASVMITNYINDKKIILNFFQIMFLFIFTGYLGSITCIIILLLIYQCENYHRLYYFIIGFVNLSALFAVWAIVLGGFFQGIRHFVQESPRVMKFLFLDDYILNGNTDGYPPKFGYQDQTIIDFFKTCLNGNGDLFSKLINKDKLNSILSETNDILDISKAVSEYINNEIQNSNLLKNDYNNLKNFSSIYTSIIKLEQIYNNLYLASDGFDKNDDIREILNKIRNKLDNDSCHMIYEYYVIKKSDCPKYSIFPTEITNEVENIYHCYVIQNLNSNTKAQYTGTSCDNDYINKAIAFIQEINIALKRRITHLRELQSNNVLTYNYMNLEAIQINDSLTKISNLLKDEINNKYPKANCSSLRFDLIDFSEYMYDKIGYKLKIIIIFSCLSGMLGYFALYAILLILKNMNQTNIYNTKVKNNYYQYNYQTNVNQYEPPNKLRKIKPIKSSKNKTDDEKFNYRYKNQFFNKEYKKKNTKRKLTQDINKIDDNNVMGNVIYNNVRKIEMKTFDNNDK